MGTLLKGTCDKCHRTNFVGADGFCLGGCPPNDPVGTLYACGFVAFAFIVWASLCWWWATNGR